MFSWNVYLFIYLFFVDEIYATKGQYGHPKPDYRAKGRVNYMRKKKYCLSSSPSSRLVR